MTREVGGALRRPVVGLIVSCLLLSPPYLGIALSSGHAKATKGHYAWTTTASLNVDRTHFVTTLLSDSRVLVAGGVAAEAGGVFSASDPRLASAEVYDPKAQRWHTTGSMITARYNAAALLLPSGKVLVVGGCCYELPGCEASNCDMPFASAELYDPKTGAWRTTRSMHIGRVGAVVVLLPSGRVLVAGGMVDNAETATASAEIYDPASQTWTATSPMTIGRFGAAAILLQSGRVLVVGGFNYQDNAESTAELYDPVTRRWTPAGILSSTAQGRGAALLPSGKVLVTGGSYDGGSSAELYDPRAGTWSPTGPMTATGNIITVLPDGKALVMFGCCAVLPPSLQQANLYDGRTNIWSTTRAFGSCASAELLHTGQVLAVGCYRRVGQRTSSTGLFAVRSP